MSLVLLLAACGGPSPTGDTASSTPPTVTESTPGDSGTPTWAPLELCINEWMPENDASLREDSGRTPDWIELHNPGAVEVDLAGWSLTDDHDEPGRGPLSGVVPAGGFVVFEADGDALPFALSADGGEVGLHAPDGRGSLVTYGAVAADFSVARATDCCVGDGCFTFDFHGTPGASNVAETLVEQELLPLGGAWRYWDQGSVAEGWAAPAFDDTRWPTGAAPLGYGDAQATVVSYGSDPYAKHVTTWFRARVDLPAADLRAAAVRLVRDDGAVVYLDGVEVARSNLPEGAIGPETLATVGVGDSEETQVFSFEVDPARLGAGSHVLGVEVHQAAPDSSDLSFDAGLVGTVPG